jgi:hypothetical protein
VSIAKAKEMVEYPSDIRLLEIVDDDRAAQILSESEDL